MLNPREDLHTHSTFSDGDGSLADNLAAAEARGILRLGCVDHVRADTSWVEEFSEAVGALRRTTTVQLVCGVEVRLLDQSGALDRPTALPGVDRIYVASRQVPLGHSTWSPQHIAAAIEARDLLAETVVHGLVDAYIGAMRSVRGAVISHPFSVLPRCGLNEQALGGAELERFLATARATGAILEIDEHGRCPSAGLVAAARAAGIEVWSSTGAHKPEHVGVYSWARAEHGGRGGARSCAAWRTPTAA